MANNGIIIILLSISISESLNISKGPFVWFQESLTGCSGHMWARVFLTHSSRPGEVDALCHAVPHLVAEEAHAHTLQILRGDLQQQQHSHEPTVHGLLSMTLHSRE